MQVIKRNGTKENVKYEKVSKSIQKACKGLTFVDVHKIATKTIGGLYDGVTTEKIDLLAVDNAAFLIIEDPEYSFAAARIFLNCIDKELRLNSIESFSDSIATGFAQGLIAENVAKFVEANKETLNAAIDYSHDMLHEYFALRTIYDRYLLRHPIKRSVIEGPQHFLLRVACGLNCDDVNGAIEMYNELANQRYATSTPTFFNSGTTKPQLSSCYLMDSPKDDLGSIYDYYKDAALLSKYAGGLGGSFTGVRGTGALIKGTNGLSKGIIPFIHTLSASVAAVNQGGKRKGAMAVYVETWHPDILQVNELRKNTGDVERRAHNLNFANWIPDLFMQRLGNKEMWTLISPDFEDAYLLKDLYGEEFNKKYIELEQKLEAMEEKPLWYKKIQTTEIWAKIMTSLGETGNGWVTWKDASNEKSNQVVPGSGYAIHSSNLCVTGDTVIKSRISGVEVDMHIDELSVFYKNGCTVEVMSFDAKTNENKWMPISNIGVTAFDAEVIEIWDNDVHVITCTPDHIIFTHRGEVKASDLLEDDILISYK